MTQEVARESINWLPVLMFFAVVVIVGLVAAVVDN